MVFPFGYNLVLSPPSKRSETFDKANTYTQDTLKQSNASKYNDTNSDSVNIVHATSKQCDGRGRAYPSLCSVELPVSQDSLMTSGLRTSQLLVVD